MKRLLYILAVTASFGLLAAGCTTQRIFGQDDYGYGYPNRGQDDEYYDDGGYYGNDGYNNNRYGSVTYDDFYRELSPYGSWRRHASYGNVWIPRVSNFRPYSTNGYWVNTNYGWNWVSNYDWGWAPFHYGRWGYDNYMGGWFWVPDYTWGPAWVTWGSGADYYGWAPMAPGLNVGISINIGNIPVNFWNFLPRRYMGHRNMYDYYLPYARNNYYVRNTTIINNYYGNSGRDRYYTGPAIHDVRRYNNNARTYNVVNTSDRSYNGRTTDNNLAVYRGSRSYTPSRNNTGTPSRSYTPSRNSDGTVNRQGTTPSRTYTPSRSTGSENYNRSTNTPSRSYTPTRNSSSNYERRSNANTTPSRSYTPSRSTGSDNYNRSTNTPSRSYSAPSSSSNSESRSSAAPSRSYTPRR